MTELASKLLNQVADRLAPGGYESLSSLQYIPFIEEHTDSDGLKLTVRAEAREEDGQLVIPVELWRGNEVCWIHLFVERDGTVRIDREIHTNPPRARS